MVRTKLPKPKMKRTKFNGEGRYNMRALAEAINSSGDDSFDFSKLTPRRQLFCFEYLTDFNATQAAIRAGYSKKAAGAGGYDILKDPEVQSFIRAVAKERFKSIGLTHERILHEYLKIALADIKDFIEFKTEKVHVGYDKEGYPVSGYRQIVKVKPSAEVDGSVINEISVSENGTLKVKLHDKKTALEKLEHFLNPVKDKEDPGVNVNVNTHIYQVEADGEKRQEVLNRIDRIASNRIKGPVDDQIMNRG